MVLEHIIVLKSATFLAKNIIHFKEKRLGREDHKLILNGSKNKRYWVASWIFCAAYCESGKI